jgi:hypothetical protein
MCELRLLILAEHDVCNVQASTSATAPHWRVQDNVEGSGLERLERGSALGSAARLTSPRSESTHLWGARLYPRVVNG